MSAIPGFQVELSRSAFMDQVERIGIAVVAQSGNLVPADKKLYALRDVTATVEKLAAGEKMAGNMFVLSREKPELGPLIRDVIH